MATSGNYRRYFELDGVKYGHTISPVTGYPTMNTLLSASIFAPDCMTADAYATACMVLGLEESFKLIDSNPELEAYFIYSDSNGQLATKMTEKTASFLVK